MTDFVNPCGGVRWRELDNGTIELEDGSVPEYAPGSPDYRNLERTYENWAGEFARAAEATGVPLAWLLAIATNETGAWSDNPEHQRTIESGDGHHSIGIMQPLPATALSHGYSLADRFDPYLNIELGGRVLVENLATKNGQAGGFPVVAAMYNGGAGRGGCNVGNDAFNLKGNDGLYATRAIKHLNSALLTMKLGSPSEASAVSHAGLWLFAVGAGGFALWSWWRSRRGIR